MVITKQETNVAPDAKKVLSGQLEEFRKALEEEIETIKKNGLSSTLLSKESRK